MYYLIIIKIKKIINWTELIFCKSFLIIIIPWNFCIKLVLMKLYLAEFLIGLFLVTLLFCLSCLRKCKGCQKFNESKLNDPLETRANVHDPKKATICLDA